MLSNVTVFVPYLFLCLTCLVPNVISYLLALTTCQRLSELERAMISLRSTFISTFIFVYCRWWTVLLEEIFPIFVFILLILSILNILGCCNGQKLQSFWTSSKIQLSWITAPRKVLSDFYFVKIVIDFTISPISETLWRPWYLMPYHVLNVTRALRALAPRTPSALCALVENILWKMFQMSLTVKKIDYIF